jgi:hypothetical protein
MIWLKCPLCKYEWEYNGAYERFPQARVTCPCCIRKFKLSDNISKLNQEFQKLNKKINKKKKK